MNLKDTYNKIAREWVPDHSKDTWWQEGTNHFLSFLKPGAAILDVGCGGGVKSRYLADRGFAVTGIDFSEEMIAIAREELPDLDFAVVDAYQLDNYHKTFDGVFAQAFVLHIPKKDVENILRQMVNKLNDGGLLYVAVKGKKEGQIEDEKTITEDNYGYPYERFFSFFEPEELRDYFTALGLG